MLGTGDLVADFSAVDQFGTTVHLSDFLEAGPLVLFFFIKAKTPG